MSILVVSGTDTDVGKTVVTAGVATLASGAGRSVAVLKPAQTGLLPGEPGDLAEVARLCCAVTTRELARYPEPLAPDTAAGRSGQPTLSAAEITAAVAELAERHDLVLVEGAGGLLVPFDGARLSLADVAVATGAPVLLVVRAGLGSRNATALSAEAMSRRGIDCLGLVIGRWPPAPGLADRCNLADLPADAGAPLLGVLPDGMAALSAPEFRRAAAASLAPELGGSFDPAEPTSGVRQNRSCIDR
jgi:dethiobiotin synthetase